MNGPMGLGTMERAVSLSAILLTRFVLYGCCFFFCGCCFVLHLVGQVYWAGGTNAT